MDADRARGAAPSSAHALEMRGAAGALAGAAFCFAGTADAGFLSLRVAGGATNEKSATMVNVSYVNNKKRWWGREAQRSAMRGVRILTNIFHAVGASYMNSPLARQEVTSLRCFPSQPSRDYACRRAERAPLSWRGGLSLLRGACAARGLVENPDDVIARDSRDRSEDIETR